MSFRYQEIDDILHSRYTVNKVNPMGLIRHQSEKIVRFILALFSLAIKHAPRLVFLGHNIIIDVGKNHRFLKQ